MTRGRVLWLLLVAGAAAGLFLGRRQLGEALGRLTGRDEEPPARQWPFERDELHGLMDRVIAEQRERVSQIEEAPQRARAQAFLDYYERRRAAAE